MTDLKNSCACGFYTLLDESEPWIIGPTGGVHSKGTCGHTTSTQVTERNGCKVLLASFDDHRAHYGGYDFELTGTWEIWGGKAVPVS